MSAPDRPTQSELDDVTPEMMEAVWAVWNRYGIRDVLQLDSELLRETLAAAISIYRKGRAGRV